MTGVRLRRMLRRGTPLLYLDPWRFINRTFNWEDFDIDRWSRTEYTYHSDRGDWVRDPLTTLREGGDCEDYAMVGASYHLATTFESVGIAFLFDYPWSDSADGNTLGHTVAYGPNTVYSSGAIFEQSLAEYVENSRYKIQFRRRIR